MRGSIWPSNTLYCYGQHRPYSSGTASELKSVAAGQRFKKPKQFTHSVQARHTASEGYTFTGPPRDTS